MSEHEADTDGGHATEGPEPEEQSHDGSAVPAGSRQTGTPDALSTDATFDWRGWLLVAVVVVSFFVMPAVVLSIPDAHWLLSAIGFSRRQAYVVFPMIPAIALGLTAVWAALTSQSPPE